MFGSWMGWALDGYDLVLMLFVLTSVSQLFFPSENSTTSLLSSFAAYVIALLIRPVGGAFFGNYGDKFGRKKTMMITIIGFSIATFSMGFLPVWEQAGLLAPILLISLRFVQGFFAGGEWGSGSVLTMESATKEKRGPMSGFLQGGFSLGFIMAAISFTIVSSVYSDNQFSEFGWRILFISGLIPGILSLIIRLKMSESTVWLEKKEKHGTHDFPLKKILSKEHRGKFLSVMMITSGLHYLYYTSLGFMPTFLENYVHVTRSDIALVMIAGTSTALFGEFFAGSISQRIGRLRTFSIFAKASIVLAVPLSLFLFESTSFFAILGYVVILTVITVSPWGPIPAFLSERFPTRIRNSASSFAYSAGLIVGAWAPMIAINLFSIDSQHIPYLLAFNIIIGAVTVLIGVRFNPETRDIDLVDHPYESQK
ncbi:transporter, major facilitator family protein [Candidatus Nitrosopumilus salaria BD31]|uniref:Transporter, major facilitator family protein n=1 Tax=Candidatus Nitrosopumilus salarius BD31 TaxID=859350 RepID=I3D377_9ARCH|nr:MFS transporter [Candidatus Nitrosopumilus salaria]EIJ66170.1 transporter, major facilitator family protein [Candidatus Nitrosopumilus salaria BD31]